MRTVFSAFFLFLFSDLDLITDMEFPKHSQRFYEHLNSPLVKVLPCLTKLMAWDLSSHSGAQNVLCVPRVLTRFRQTYLQHLNVLKEEDVSIALPFCFTVCTFLLGPWPFQCLCAAKCSRPAGTGLPSRDQQSSHFQNKNLVKLFVGHTLDFFYFLQIKSGGLGGFSFHYCNAAAIFPDMFWRLKCFIELLLKSKPSTESIWWHET